MEPEPRLRRQQQHGRIHHPGAASRHKGHGQDHHLRRPGFRQRHHRALTHAGRSALHHLPALHPHRHQLARRGTEDNHRVGMALRKHRHRQSLCRLCRMGKREDHQDRLVSETKRNRRGQHQVAGAQILRRPACHHDPLRSGADKQPHHRCQFL